jgi:hypothetical protein
MNKRFHAFCLLLLGILSLQYMHTFHFSETLIEWKPERQQLEMTLKVFTDDWDIALGDTLQNKNLEMKILDPLYGRYLSTHSAFSANGKKIDWTYLGFERDGDVYYHFLESAPMEEPTTIDCQYIVLMEVYEDQKNLLNFRKNGKTTSLYFLDKTHPQTLQWP